MSTYKQLQEQIKQLQNKAEEIRKSELANTIHQIKTMMADYGITVSDLKLSNKKKSAKVRNPLAPKYRDPVSGETWSGRGKAPRWIDKKNIEKFLIK